MSKACKTLEEAEATQEMYAKKDGTKSYITEKQGKFLVYREGDNKVLKSVAYLHSVSKIFSFTRTTTFSPALVSVFSMLCLCSTMAYFATQISGDRHEPYRNPALS